MILTKDDVPRRKPDPLIHLESARRLKGWGFCHSCGGRRMADVVAHLVDRVLPRAPVRQWVLSLPFALRYRLSHDARLMGDVLRVFVRRMFADLRRRARLERLCRPAERRSTGPVARAVCPRQSSYLRFPVRHSLDSVTISGSCRTFRQGSLCFS